MDKAFIHKVKQTVLKHIEDEKFGVDNLASEIGFSKSQIWRKIKASTGKNTNEFIRDIRLQEAAKLIQKSKLTASEIAYRVGFSSPSYFNKCFHNHFGVTPGEYNNDLEASSLSEKKEKSETAATSDSYPATGKTNIIQQKPTGRKKYILLSLLGLLIIALSYYLYTDYTNKTILFKKKTNKISIAVLPFKDMSPEDTQWFCDGVTDNILSKLSQINGLSVISRTSSDTYKNTNKKIPKIAQELGVSYIIEGSVTLHNNEVKINTQLINANDKHLWSKEYTDNFKHIFTIQQNVAKQIAEQLQIDLTPEEEKRIDFRPTDNLEALKLYQKGRLLADNRTLKDLESSIVYYQKAIELDPNYAESYAEIANSYFLMGGYGQKNRDTINSYIEKALEIDPNTVRAYTVKAMIYLKNENWKQAKIYFDKAITLNPNDATTHHHFAYYYKNNPNRDITKYLVQISIAQQLDPLSIPINDELISSLLINNKIEEAEEHFNKVNFGFTDKLKIWHKQKIINKKCEIICLEKKDRTEAIKFYQKAIKEDPMNSFLYKQLGSAYDAILNDDKNAVKYYKKAYQLDSTNISIAINYNFMLIESGNFNDAKILMESKNYKSLIAKNTEFYKIYNSYYYYYFKKDYNKAQEILSGTLKKEFYFDKISILAHMGKVDEVYKLLEDYDVMDITNKAFIFAILKEKDSMYYYLNKEDIDYIWVNGRFEFDPYRKEERYKAFLKKNYLPITHWNK